MLTEENKKNAREAANAVMGFSWRGTPQGADYWYKVHKELVELSEEDEELIQTGTRVVVKKPYVHAGCVGTAIVTSNSLLVLFDDDEEVDGHYGGLYVGKEKLDTNRCWYYLKEHLEVI